MSDLPGLGVSKADLIKSIDHHAAHLCVALGELIEVLETLDDDEQEAHAVSCNIERAYTILRAAKGWMA